MSLYTDTIRRYALDDRYVGTLDAADGTGEVGLDAGEAGKRLAVRFALRLRDGKVCTVRFQVFGCGFTVAACAAAAELVDGQPLERITQLTPQQIDTHLGGLPSERDYCAQLALDALQAAASSTGKGGEIRQVDAAAQHASDVPHLVPDDPLYRTLLATALPNGVEQSDRQLFAGLLAIACRDSRDPAAALGLTAEEFDQLLEIVFPTIAPAAISGRGAKQPEAAGGDLRALLCSYLPNQATLLGSFLALALAARACCPGHLWVAMGLQERPQLTAAIGRHLPALRAANNKNMRWKRFFFKQLCNQNGGNMCKTPDCGVCSDYALCFAPEEP